MSSPARSMTRWLSSSLLATAALLPVAAPLAKEQLDIDLSFDPKVIEHIPGPKMGTAEDEEGHHLREIIVDEDASGWIRRVTVESFTLEKWGKRTTAEAVEAYKAAEEARCPGKTEWIMRLEEPHRAIIESHTAECGGQPARSAGTLVILGKEARWQVVYGLRRDRISPENRRRAYQSINDAVVLTMTSATQGTPTWGPDSGPPWVKDILSRSEWSDGVDVASHLPIPADWKLTANVHDQSNKSWWLQWTPPGQSPEDAAEALTIYRVPEPDWNSMDYRDSIIAAAQDRCGKKATVKERLLQRDRAILEERAPRCQKVEQKYRLSVALHGQKSLFIISYVARSADDSSGARSAWLPRLKMIRLDPAPADSADKPAAGH